MQQAFYATDSVRADSQRQTTMNKINVQQKQLPHKSQVT